VKQDDSYFTKYGVKFVWTHCEFFGLFRDKTSRQINDKNDPPTCVMALMKLGLFANGLAKHLNFQHLK
jgi:hypothetical protein